MFEERNIVQRIMKAAAAPVSRRGFFSKFLTTSMTAISMLAVGKSLFATGIACACSPFTTDRRLASTSYNTNVQTACDTAEQNVNNSCTNSLCWGCCTSGCDIAIDCVYSPGSGLYACTAWGFTCRACS